MEEIVKLTDDPYLESIGWLNETIVSKARAIIGGGYRTTCYKAAELIAALGEIMESRRMVKGRQNL
ncbi:MAG: hypothetical protein WAV55_13075 [Clostridiaceae bacterium]